MDNHYKNLLIELECTICTNYMSPPIRQCVIGHSICEGCRKKLLKCPLCQEKFTESRNISLEALAVKMQYPCINENSGCKARLSYNERQAHETKCSFRGYQCALEKCSWVGKLTDLPQHWASKRTFSKSYQATNICHTKIKSESYYVNMVEAHNQLFWFKCKLSKNILYWSVQYIGNAKEAENYYYEIEIFKPGRPRRKILLSSYCYPVDIDNTTLFKKTCLSLHCEIVEPFVGDDQLIMYYMRVHENKEDKDVEVVSASGSRPQTRNRSRENKYRHRSKGRQHQSKNFQDRKPCNKIVLI